MRKQYDDFTQLKLKDMSRTISEMTYRYINPDTSQPTVVPALHYEKILDEVQQSYVSDITSRQFLTIMYNQLTALKKEDEKYFIQALLCMDMDISPKDMKISEQIALGYASEYAEGKKKEEKKNHHFLRQDYSDRFCSIRDDLNFQASVISATDSDSDILN